MSATTLSADAGHFSRWPSSAQDHHGLLGGASATWKPLRVGGADVSKRPHADKGRPGTRRRIWGARSLKTLSVLKGDAFLKIDADRCSREQANALAQKALSRL